MTDEMSSRSPQWFGTWPRLLLTTILVSALFLVQHVAAAGNPRLVLVSYGEGSPPTQAIIQGARLLHCRPGLFTALADDTQIAAMRDAGFEVRVVDSDVTPDSYYLAYLPEGANASDLAVADDVYSYDGDSYLVSAGADVAERLSQAGVELVKLPLAEEPACCLPPDRVATGPAASDLEHEAEIQAMVDAVSSDALVNYVCELQDDDALGYCNELGSRYSYNTLELDQAASYLYGQLSAVGLSVAYDPFVYNGMTMKNVTAELPGADPLSRGIYIICAHYDSTSNDPYGAAPGADDNASGSAAVLEAARILSQYRFAHTLRFVLFAGEEQGLIGSAHYAAVAHDRGDLIEGAINLDMIGYESVPPNDHSVELHAGTDPASITLADAMMAAVSLYGIQLTPEKITSGATTRSDHASFWSQGYAAVLGIEDMQDFSPYYHRTTDTLAHMRTSLMLQFTKAAVATLAELASPVVVSTPTSTATPVPTPVQTASATVAFTASATATATPIATHTPTATATTAPEWTTIVLQQGLNGYSGAGDTEIHEYAPNANYCTAGQLRIGYKRQHEALFGFDLAGIPAGASVTRALLHVYVMGWSGSDVSMSAYALKRNADWCRATWNQSSSGEAWGLPGAGDASSDRRASPESSVTTSGIKKWYALDLTGLVQEWASGSLANRGVLLRGTSALGLVYLASSENPDLGLRPKLLVTYSSENGVVPTPTKMGSPAPAMSPTPSPTWAAGPATITLQQGNSGYEGAEDTFLYEWSPGVRFCRSASLQVGYKQQNVALLAFDLGSIPASATVMRATLQLWATGWGGQNMTLGAYRVLRVNECCQATWTQAGDGVPWGWPGCNDPGNDRRAQAESSVTTTGISKWYSFDLTELVHGWVSGGVENHGVLLRDTYSMSQFYFASAQSGMVERRPRLVITYR